MLVDDITIRLKAGDGGRGAVAFQRLPMAEGPTGGSGGRGGSVYLEGVSDLSALLQYKGRPEAVAEDGGDGRGQFVDGRDGDDVVLKVPVGTRVTNVATGFSRDILSVGERILAAGGGEGGRGNFHFRSGSNTSPKQFEPGKPGDDVIYRLELMMIADVGLVGLPNAGKSSLLNALTSAKAKVGNYAFTTLEPNLGVFYDIIIADIPGLIEGASGGKGLGTKFLRHIERTRVLFHLVSAESDDPVRDYRTVRGELAAYAEALAHKQEYVFLSHADQRSEEDIRQVLGALRSAGVEATPLSVIDDVSLESVKRILRTIEAERASL